MIKPEVGHFPNVYAQHETETQLWQQFRQGSRTAFEQLTHHFYRDLHFYGSRCYPIDVIERLGGGDAFTAGMLHGIALRWTPEQIIEFATDASALKRTIPGDLNLLSKGEILDVANGNLSGLIKRRRLAVEGEVCGHIVVIDETCFHKVSCFYTVN